ncbi:hypothetical protein GGD40_005471 [Paraburkholderia bryophila]|uniref:Uncharacterized protein n=1 Tax=Paraburkholderia bryophila TaxID=420952 RepID=A0A7Y9WRL9_9BURK|nr:hypothetical protein [Paraburkholderia bryophila]NYH25900.1 hypothetical protein [Paraburkholderia bryophila]
MLTRLDFSIEEFMNAATRIANDVVVRIAVIQLIDRAAVTERYVGQQPPVHELSQNPVNRCQTHVAGVFVETHVNRLGREMFMSVRLKKFQHQDARKRGSQTGSLKNSVSVHGLGGNEDGGAEGGEARRRIQGRRRIEEIGGIPSLCGQRANRQWPNYACPLLKGTLSERFERRKAAR